MIDFKNKTDWQHTITLKVGEMFAFRLDHVGKGQTLIGMGTTLADAIEKAVSQIE